MKLIAELGINHEGDTSSLLTMVELAAESGANAVKLQLNNPSSNYFIGTKSFDMFSQARLHGKAIKKFFSLARSLDLEPIVTCGDLETFKLVSEYEPRSWKLSSGLANHRPLLDKILQTGAEIIISTGVADVALLDRTYDVICRNNAEDRLTFLQCTSLYPCPDQNVDLNVMHTLKARYDCSVGYSDHSKDSLACLVAAVMGAVVIEKHFSLDPKRLGFDHAISASPEEMADLTQKLARLPELMGSFVKKIPTSISPEKILRHLVARHDLAVGQNLTVDCIDFRRLPADFDQSAISVEDWEAVSGSILRCSITRDTVINLEMLEGF